MESTFVFPIFLEPSFFSRFEVHKIVYRVPYVFATNNAVLYALFSI